MQQPIYTSTSLSASVAKGYYKSTITITKHKNMRKKTLLQM